MYLYSLRIALGAMEEARWLNDVSKDPELSRLAHEVLVVARILKSLALMRFPD